MSANLLGLVGIAIARSCWLDFRCQYHSISDTTIPLHTLLPEIWGGGGLKWFLLKAILLYYKVSDRCLFMNKNTKQKICPSLNEYTIFAGFWSQNGGHQVYLLPVSNSFVCMALVVRYPIVRIFHCIPIPFWMEAGYIWYLDIISILAFFHSLWIFVFNDRAAFVLREYNFKWPLTPYYLMQINYILFWLYYTSTIVAQPKWIIFWIVVLYFSCAKEKGLSCAQTSWRKIKENKGYITTMLGYLQQQKPVELKFKKVKDQFQ